MKASDVMRRSVISIPQNATLREIVQAFVKNHIDSLPVVDAAERVVGLIVIEDLVDVFLPRYAELLRDFAVIQDKGQLASLFNNSFKGPQLPQENLVIAADIMNSHLEWVQVEDSLIEAASNLQSQQRQRLPVVDRDRKLMGLISEYDIVLALLQGSPTASVPAS